MPKPDPKVKSQKPDGEVSLSPAAADRFRALLHHANDLAYSVSINPSDRTWHLDFLSDRIYDFSGCQAEEFVTDGPLDSVGPFGLKDPETSTFELIHPDDADQIMRSTRELVAGQPVRHEYRVRNRKSGEFRWVEDRSEPEKDSAGDVVGIWGIVRDVTERHQREGALSQLAAIVAVSDDAIVGLDLSGRILSWNPAASETYGFKTDEVMGQSFFDLVASDRADSLKKQVVELSEGQFKEDAVHRNSEGREMPVSMTASAICDSAGKAQMVAVVVRDLTDRQQLELQLMQSQKMEAVGRLAGGIAHDFNNILTIIQGTSETLMEDLSKMSGTEALVDDAATVRKAATRAAALTRQLLAFSRKQLLQPRPLVLDAAVREMQELLERLIGEDIELQIITRGTGTVQADPVQLQQVLMNLAVNAREAMPRGGRLLIETADVELDESYPRHRVGSRPGPHAMLAVSDTGEGMDPRTVQQAFDPFFTTKEGGTGLGLSTVYGIIKQSGGNVWAYSEPGKGTTVKVYLPVIDAEPDVLDEGGLGVDVVSPGEGTILVVEDEDGVRKLMRKTLEDHGFAVLDAANGVVACGIAANFQGAIDLVLTDLVMPLMGGLELASQIREQHPEVRVLYTSGYTDGFVEQGGVREELGASFLQKPFTKAGLLKRVHETLSAKE
jgi:PAS domain S-box-containing protein